MLNVRLEVKTKQEAGISPACLRMLEAALLRVRQRLRGAGVRLLRCIQKVAKASHGDHIELLLQRMILRHEQYAWMKDGLKVELPVAMESPRVAVHSQDRIALFERLHEEPNISRHAQFVLRRSANGADEGPPPQGERMKTKHSAVELDAAPTKASHRASWMLPQQDSTMEVASATSSTGLGNTFRRFSHDDSKSLDGGHISIGDGVVAAMASKARLYGSGNESYHALMIDEVLPKPLEDDVPATEPSRRDAALARPSTTPALGTSLRGKLDAIAVFPPLPLLTSSTSGYTDKVCNEHPLPIAADNKVERVCPGPPGKDPAVPSEISVAAEDLAGSQPAEQSTAFLPHHTLPRCSTAPARAQKGQQLRHTLPRVGSATCKGFNKTAPSTPWGSGKAVRPRKRTSRYSSATWDTPPSPSTPSSLGDHIGSVDSAWKDLMDRHDQIAVHCFQNPASKGAAKDWLNQIALSGHQKAQMELRKKQDRCRDRRALHSAALGVNKKTATGLERAFSQEMGYLHACAKRGLNPRLMKFFALPSQRLDLADMCLGDEDLDAVVEALQMPARGLPANKIDAIASVTEINLMGNRRLTDAATAKFLSVAVAGRGTHMGTCFGRIQVLNLRYCSGLGERAVEVLVQIFAENRDLLQLEDLDITGINVMARLWPPLVQGLAYSPRLRRCILSDTGCGRQSQTSCEEVASLLEERRCKLLECLDISGNFFLHEGCQAMSRCLAGSHTNLKELDMSHNAGFAANLLEDVEDIQKVPTINPITHVLEVLGETSLLKVSFVNCRLSFPEDCILEDVISSSDIVHLDVSDNPHGELGLRCLLRLLVNGHFSGSQLDNLVVENVREFVSTEDVLVYDYSHPSSTYRLQLETPQHRSVLRMLLKRSETATGSGLKCFHNAMLNKHPAEMSTLCFKRLDRGGDDWQVPRSGNLKFSFELPTFFHPDDELEDVLRKFSKTQKVFVRFKSFTWFMKLFRAFRDQRSRELFMDAMSIDLTFKLCQVNLLKAAFPEESIAIVRSLLPAVKMDVSKRSLSDLLDSCKVQCDQLQVKQAQNQSRSLLYMNTLHADGHYQLDLANRMDRASAERLLIVSRWQRARSEFRGWVDMSEMGNRECWRRSQFMKKKLNFSSQDWTLPQHGHLSFDFVLSEVVRREATPPEILETIWRMIRESSCNFRDRIQALRTISHQLVITPAQMVKILKVFPMWDPSRGGKHEVSDLNVMPRCEVFILFYNRTRYRADLISPKYLYNLELLHREEIEDIRKRLGWIHTFDLNNLHREDSNLGVRHGPFDLASYEGRVMVKSMLAVSFSEPSQNFFDNFYTPHQDMHDRGYPFVIPMTWIPEPASFGHFTTTWMSRRDEVNMHKRKQICLSMLGRENSPDLKGGSVSKFLTKLKQGAKKEV